MTKMSPATNLLSKMSPTATNMIRMDHSNVLMTFHKYEIDGSKGTKEALVNTACRRDRDQHRAWNAGELDAHGGRRSRCRQLPDEQGLAEPSHVNDVATRRIASRRRHNTAVSVTTMH